MQNQGESDVDCGGENCSGCDPGHSCVAPSDCRSGVCTTGVCQAPTCSDGVTNQDETDTDCGGSTCARCPVGSHCLVATDCINDACEGNLCLSLGCDDGTQNGDETGLDCGGGSCEPCPPGGGCTIGQGARDCTSGVCLNGICQQPSCTDVVQNGDETDIDCGGSCSTRCDPGEGCAVAADCQSGVCTSGTCAAPSCTDVVQNGDESDVDCGGTCPDCVAGQTCSVATTGNPHAHQETKPRVYPILGRDHTGDIGTQSEKCRMTQGNLACITH